MNLNMDLTQDGLSMFFKDYQLEALKILWKSNPGLISREVWEQVNQNPQINISRASIINFLNDMVELGILNTTSETGKGGHRPRYSPKYDEAQAKQYLTDAVKNKLNTL
jgi:predicted transcriptional regulator